MTQLSRLILDPTTGDRVLVSRDGTRVVNECGPAPDHLYCLLCPCNYVGCWPDHPPIWVRDDVVCPLPPGVPPGTYQPAICKYGGAVKVTRAGRSWCYMPAGSLGITRRRDQIPPGAIIAEPGAMEGITIECLGVPQGVAACDHPDCVPDGGGECECGCDRVCAVLIPHQTDEGPCNGAIFCCGGELDDDGKATFDWNYTATYRSGHDYLINVGDSWCCSNRPCSDCMDGVTFFEAVSHTGAEVSRDGCTVCKEVITVQRTVTHNAECERVVEESEPEVRVVCRSYADAIDPAYNRPYEYRDRWDDPSPPFGCPRGGWDIRETVTRSCTGSRRERTEEIWSVASAPDGMSCGCNRREWRTEVESLVYSGGEDDEGCCAGCQFEVCGHGVASGGDCPDLATAPTPGPGGGSPGGGVFGLL